MLFRSSDLRQSPSWAKALATRFSISTGSSAKVCILLTFHRQPLFSLLRLDLGNRLDSLRPASSPSEIIGSVTKIRELLEGVATHIYLGRPSGAPAAIFNPALATLQHRLDHLDHVNVTRQDVMHAADYLNQAIGFYSDETGREKALQGLLDVAVDQGGSWNKQLSWADGIKPDCCWWHKDFLTMVLELKNTVGLAGNPVLQAIVDYSKIISQEKVRYAPSAHLYNHGLPLFTVQILSRVLQFPYCPPRCC